MGTLISNPTALASYDGQIFKKGIDYGRSTWSKDLGTEVADPASTIRAGMLVSRNSSGYIIPANLVGVYGIAGWGKSTNGISVNVDEAVTLVGTTASTLRRGSISNVTVRSAANMAGTVYAVATDYTLNTTNGTVARQGGSTIADGATVYVTYTYALVDADYEFDGRYFQNQNEDRTLYQEGRLKVLTDWSRVYTVEWVTGDGVATAPGSTYTTDLSSANSKLYCSAEGKFTNDSTSAEFVGRVYQIPTASDPYMGVVTHGNPMP